MNAGPAPGTSTNPARVRASDLRTRKSGDAINPSAENIAKYFYDESNTKLKSATNGRVRVKDVTVFETDTTTAKYSE